MIAISLFLFIVLLTVGITFVAARRTRTASDFYVAGNRIGGVSNGFAIAGDFMSAATLLGIVALMVNAGFDAAIYLGAPIAAFSIMIFLLTDKLKELGRYTFTDIVCARLADRPIRILAALCALVFSIMYLVAQVVGAGAVIQILFGIPYRLAVLLVTTLMVLYVSLGGMLATTWVQITKAIMLLAGVAVLALLALARFDFDFAALYTMADAQYKGGASWMHAGGLRLSAFSAVSLGFSLFFGLVGSPHLLMRFFTVPDARAARQSAFVALGAVAFVNFLIFFVIGAAALALVSSDAGYFDAAGNMVGGTNMASLHLAHAVGGDVFFGVMAAVVFATILAVVAGLTLAAVSAISHDLYANALRGGDVSEREQVRVSRVATVGVGVVIMLLGILFEAQNIAYLTALAMAVSSSTNFPLLMLSIYWRGLTTRGAVAGGVAGLLVAITLVVLGPAVWVDVLGNAEPVFSERYPALYSLAAALLAMFAVSKSDRSAQARIDREKFSVMAHSDSV